MILIFSTSTPVIDKTKRLVSLFATLPLTLALISCDTPSSTAPDVDNSSATSETSSTAVSQNATDQRAQSATLSDQMAETASEDNTKNTDEGQSLISAAKTDNNTYNQRSTSSTEGMLQATLMGDYGGMVPCPSCDNIDVTLNLFADGSVTKTSIYKNAKPSKAPYIESGVYRQDNDKITIVYQKKRVEVYLIQDNHLVKLDESSQPDDDYTLSRK